MNLFQSSALRKFITGCGVLVTLCGIGVTAIGAQDGALFLVLGPFLIAFPFFVMKNFKQCPSCTLAMPAKATRCPKCQADMQKAA